MELYRTLCIELFYVHITSLFLRKILIHLMENTLKNMTCNQNPTLVFFKYDSLVHFWAVTKKIPSILKISNIFSLMLTPILFQNDGL